MNKIVWDDDDVWIHQSDVQSVSGDVCNNRTTVVLRSGEVVTAKFGHVYLYYERGVLM